MILYLKWLYTASRSLYRVCLLFATQFGKHSEILPWYSIDSRKYLFYEFNQVKLMIYCNIVVTQLLLLVWSHCCNIPVTPVRDALTNI